MGYHSGEVSLDANLAGLDGDAVREVAKLVELAGTLKVTELEHEGHGKIPMVLKPSGFDLEDLRQFMHPHPDRVRAVVTHNSVVSFCEYVNRFKGVYSTIFASVLEAPYEFTAILDYHGTDEGDMFPDWGTHVAKLVLTQTDEWKTWMESNNRSFNQVEFAAFIEDNLNDIVEPDGATMLELALNLNATQESGFKGKLNLQNGDVGLVVDQQTDAVALGKNGEIAIPKELSIKLAPFRGIEQSTIQARFRYNLRPPKLTLGYQMIRPKALLDAVVGDAHDLICAETKLPVYSGDYRSTI